MIIYEGTNNEKNAIIPCLSQIFHLAMNFTPVPQVVNFFNKSLSLRSVPAIYKMWMILNDCQKLLKEV